MEKWRFWTPNITPKNEGFGFPWILICVCFCLVIQSPTNQHKPQPQPQPRCRPNTNRIEVLIIKPFQPTHWGSPFGSAGERSPSLAPHGRCSIPAIHGTGIFTYIWRTGISTYMKTIKINHSCIGKKPVAWILWVRNRHPNNWKGNQLGSTWMSCWKGLWGSMVIGSMENLLHLYL